MTARELLLECKLKLKIESDYALAKALEIPRPRMSEYMHGKINPDIYALTRIAIILKQDPIQLIAKYEAATEKNEIKRKFWEGFISRASKAGRACTLGLLFGLSCLIGLNANMEPAGFFKRR